MLVENYFFMNFQVVDDSPILRLHKYNPFDKLATFMESFSEGETILE